MGQAANFFKAPNKKFFSRLWLCSTSYFIPFTFAILKYYEIRISSSKKITVANLQNVLLIWNIILIIYEIIYYMKDDMIFHKDKLSISRIKFISSYNLVPTNRGPKHVYLSKGQHQKVFCSTYIYTHTSMIILLTT